MTEKMITREFLENFPDEKRYYLIADNPDWEDTIGPVLYETGKLFEIGSLNISGYFTIMRFVCEIIYVMGYLRGQKNPE